MIACVSIKTSEKKCTGCGQIKPETDFYQQRNALRSQCKSCYSIYNKEYRIKHHDKALEYSRTQGCGWERNNSRERWKISDRDKHSKYLFRTYGINIEKYEAIFRTQGNVCAICKQPCNRSTTDRLCVDHDHQSGIVRGLLCFQCNVGLGKFKDNANILRAAADYLDTFTPKNEEKS